MTALFRYDAARLDERLLEWVHQHHRPSAQNIEDASSRAPGFKASDLVGAGSAELSGPVTNELWNLAYWLFVPAGYAPVHHPSAGSEAKSILAAKASHHPFFPQNVACLAVWATPGGDARRVLLVPFPQVGDALVGKVAATSFERSRDELHDAAKACVDRVNLVWAAAVALAATGEP